MKKLTLFLLTALMIISFNATTVEAKATTKLSNSSVTLNVGKKKTIKLKNYNKKKIKKAKWSTTNKKVASIKATKEKCTITAKKAGKATIKVKYNGKTYKCKVTVKKTTKATTEKSTTETSTTEKTTEKSTTETTTEKTTEQPTTEKPTTEQPTETPTTPNEIPAHDCWFSSVSVHYEAENYGEYGYTIWSCSKCGKELDKIQDTNPKEPSFTLEWVTTKEATCTTDGQKVQYKVYENGTKEEVKTETIKALDHDFSILVSETIATCPHVNSTATYKCSRCNETDEHVYAKHSFDGFNDYTAYIDLGPHNYDPEWMAWGSYGTCVLERECNHCKHIDRYGDHYTIDILICQVQGFKNQGYRIILRSNTRTDNVDDVKALVDEDWTK